MNRRRFLSTATTAGAFVGLPLLGRPPFENSSSDRIFTQSLVAGKGCATQTQVLFRQQDLFVGGLDGVNIYRIPALIVTPKGTILAFCEAREGEGNDGDPADLVLKRSYYDVGPSKPRMLNGFERIFGYGVVKWGGMQIVLPGKGKAIMNPCPVVDHKTGTIWMLCWKVSGGLQDILRDPNDGRVLVLKSTDDGLTWSAPLDMRMGRVRCRDVALSRDGGETWYREFQDEALPDQECQASLLRYSTKTNGGEDRLLFANIPNPEERINLTVRLSNDEGKTWPVSRRVYDGPGGLFVSGSVA